MSNHYHLLIETPVGNLSQIMRHINGLYQLFQCQRKRAGHLLQGRYKAVLVDRDAYALELSRYIHLNPVRAGMSQRPEEYAWSSYQSYIGQKPTPDWLQRREILAHFDGDEGRYRAFVEDGLTQGVASPLANALASTILGRSEFVNEMEARCLSGKRPNRDVPGLRKAAGGSWMTSWRPWSRPWKRIKAWSERWQSTSAIATAGRTPRDRREVRNRRVSGIAGKPTCGRQDGNDECLRMRVEGVRPTAGDCQCVDVHLGLDPTSSFSTSRPTISTPSPSPGWSTTFSSIRAPSSPSPTTATFSTTWPDGFWNSTAARGSPGRGNYSSWLEQKQERLRREEKAESNRQKDDHRRAFSFLAIRPN